MDRERVLAFNEKNIAEFRASGGRIAAFGDAPVLLLTTTGARSGQPRTNPMMYLADARDPDRVYVFASAAGADSHPAWFHNIVAHPEGLGVEIGQDAMTADAEVLPDPLRGQVYDLQARRYPGFAAYRAKTTRPIPVVALNVRRETAAPPPRRRRGGARARGRAPRAHRRGRTDRHALGRERPAPVVTGSSTPGVPAYSQA